MRKSMFLKRPLQKSHDINEKLFNVETNDGYKNISISSVTAMSKTTCRISFKEGNWFCNLAIYLQF